MLRSGSFSFFFFICKDVLLAKNRFYLIIQRKTPKDYRNMMAREFETLDSIEWTLVMMAFSVGEYEWINKLKTVLQRY